MRPEVDFAGRQIQGTRNRQEDFYAFERLESGGLLLVLADGVGGQGSGHVASLTAVNGFFEGFHRSKQRDPHRLASGLKLANRRIAESQEKEAANLGMATTLVSVLIQGDCLYWISVGDSPLFLFRERTVRRLNADHSASGQGIPGLSRNTLVSFLAGGRIPLIDWTREPLAIKPSDILMASSDGILTLSLDEIADAINGTAMQDASQIVDRILQDIEAKSKVHQDNATIALVKFGAFE